MLTPGDDILPIVGPIAKSFGVKISASGPFQTACVVDQAHLIEYRQISQRSKYGSMQYRLKVNRLDTAVVESNGQGVVSDDLEVGDSIELMSGHDQMPPYFIGTTKSYG